MIGTTLNWWGREESWFRVFFPPEATAHAGVVDLIHIVWIIITVIVCTLIFGTILFCMIRYREGSQASRLNPPKTSLFLEALWIGVPLVVSLSMCVWAARAYLDIYLPPENALTVYVVAKQWMWKTQHPNGAREINELHVPVGRPVRLVMTSEDVIHSFYVPAFRIKQDVLPGRYTEIWFNPIREGEWDILCAEYCGAHHSHMRGRVVVMKAAEYQGWLGGESFETGGSSSSKPGGLAGRGRDLFQKRGCINCHGDQSTARAPTLKNLFGSKVALQGGGEVVADENYLRESILDPTAKIVHGYDPIMPSFQGQISEEEVIALVEYLKSLQSAHTGGASP